VPHSRLGDNAQVDKALAGHEHLDCTGFMHMDGRLYDPRIGRFLSPDPVVSDPSSRQGWNIYSHVGGWPWDDGHGAGFLVPAVSFFIGRELESVPRSRAVSLNQEATPADGRMSSPLPPWLTFTPGEAASIGIGLIPLVGTAASVYEVATGRDLVTGEEVHRGMALIGVVPGGKLVRSAVRKAADDVSDATLHRRLRRDLEAQSPPTRAHDKAGGAPRPAEEVPERSRESRSRYR